MVVRLSDIRSGNKEEKKSGVVRLSDMRAAIIKDDQQKLKSIGMDFESRFGNKPKTVNFSEPPPISPSASLDDIGMGYADQVKTFDTFNKGIQSNAKPPLPSYHERVMEKVDKAPQILKPLAAIPAAIEELPFSRAVRQITMPEKTANEPRVGGLAALAASVAVPLTVPGAGLSGTGMYQQAGNVLQRFAPNLGNSLGGRVVNEAIKQVSTGAVLSPGATLALNPQATNKELLESSAYGAGGGLVLGTATPLLGAAFTRFMNRGKSVAPEAEQAVRTAIEAPQPKVMGNLRNASQDQYVNNIMGQIRDDVNQRMTPPLENPNELAKWLKSHLGDDVSLNEVRKLSFEEMRQLSEEVRKSMSMYDVASQVARARGFNLDEVFAGKLPSIKETVARDASRRAYGVGESAPQVNIQRTIRPEGPALPREPISSSPLASPETPRVVREPITPNVVERPEITPTRLRDLRTSEQPASTVTEPPINPVNPSQQRGFAQTLIESDKTPPTFKQNLKSNYTPLTNEETVARANKRLDKDIEEATSFALGNSRFSAEKAATAQRLIDHYNSTGNYQRAVDVAERVAEDATRAGQGIQALSLFDRLSPEGVLIRAQRIAKKTNENLPAHAKEVKVTAEMAENIKALTQSSQRLTGVKDLSNDVQAILERAKSGETLSTADTESLKRFVQESREFIKETSKPVKAPKPPKAPSDKRIADNMVKFLESAEEAAKARLRAKGIRMSSTPLDIWADYAIIGAAKMAKGTVKFADWSATMVKELGEEIRPHLNQLYERAKQTFESSSKRVTQQTVSKAERITENVIKNKNLSPEDAESLRKLAQNVSKLSGEEQNLVSQDLQIVLQALEKPTLLRKVAVTQTIGQLLNPKTIARNVIGNELFYRVERLNKYVATPIDIVRSKITGGPRTVTFKTNADGEFWHNFLRGARAGWRGTNVNGIQTQYDLGGPAFRSKLNPMTYLEKALGASLRSFDTAAYMRGVNKTLGEQATLRAINEGLKGEAKKVAIQKYIREADDNIKALADEYGKYITFQDNNLISKGLVAAKKGLNVGKDFGIGDLVLKYPKTPGALLHRAIEYSPAGFLRSAMLIAKPFFKKEVTTSEITHSISRAIIGSLGLTGMGYALADLGILTGAVSKDKDIRELQRQSGQGQYQINLSALFRFVKSNFDPESAKLEEDDTLYSYDWAQPVSMPLSVGANVSKNMNEGKQKFSGLAGTAYNSVEGGLGTLTEQSVLQGLKRAAEGYPGQTFTDKVMDVLSDIPSSFTPTLGNQIRQTMDNSKPETYSPNKLQQSLNKAQAKIPGLAQRLPIQYDTLGREKKTYDNNSLFNVFLNPGFVSKYKLSPEAKFITELIEESGDESLAPRVPGKSITLKSGESIKLDGDLYSRLQYLQGEEIRQRIETIEKKSDGKTMERKSKWISTALTEAGKAAKKQLKKEMGVK